MSLAVVSVMQRIYRIFWIWGLLFPAFTAAAPAELGAVSYASADRLVFNLSGPVRHHAFVLKSPSRLVVDFAGAKMAQASTSRRPNIRYLPRP
ncbi:AMIN domain-containing protein [Methylomonas koyamae]|uniref:AMIN domain-containing protein n=1 Tax=Methylomonas koyamae TaxID=702114 RepID=UPI0021102D0D|nr:AMIN domain-containing protein [Methylomonas koyamae]